MDATFEVDEALHPPFDEGEANDVDDDDETQELDTALKREDELELDDAAEIALVVEDAVDAEAPGGH